MLRLPVMPSPQVKPHLSQWDQMGFEEGFWRVHKLKGEKE